MRPSLCMPASLVVLLFKPFLVSSTSASSFLPHKGQTIADEINCYSLPYGSIGFVSHLITYYTIFALSRGRSPFTWKKNKHWKLDFTLGAIGLVTTTSLAVLTVVRCRHRWEFVLLGIWKMILSLTLGFISVHAAVAVRNTDRSTGKSRTTKEGVLWWLAFYVPGLVVGLTGLGSLAKSSWTAWRKRRTPIVVTGIFLGATFVSGVFAIGILLYRRRRLKQPPTGAISPSLPSSPALPAWLGKAELNGRPRIPELPASYSVHELPHNEKRTIQMLEDERVSTQMAASSDIRGYKLRAFYDELYGQEVPPSLSRGISYSPGSEFNHERILEEGTQPLQHDELQSLNSASASLSDKSSPTDYAHELPGSEGRFLGSDYRSSPDLRQNAGQGPHEQIWWEKQLVSTSFGKDHVDGKAESTVSASLFVNRRESSSRESYEQTQPSSYLPLVPVKAHIADSAQQPAEKEFAHSCYTAEKLPLASLKVHRPRILVPNNAEKIPLPEPEVPGFHRQPRLQEQGVRKVFNRLLDVVVQPAEVAGMLSLFLFSSWVIAVGLLAALYSDWALAFVAGNMAGVPSPDNSALYWTYFFAKRIPLFSI